MKVLLINGSPRWKGNTNRALEEAAAALEAEGVETELVWIGNKEIRGCIACGICGKTGDKHCVFAEDCCNELIAKAAGAKSAAMADPAVAQRRTGYVVGGISPLGQSPAHRLFIDSACLDHETMIVSGGRRGLSVELSPLDLVELTDAEVTDLAQV